MHNSLISVVIPVINEASNLEATLLQVLEAENVEVIVVDGGSQDETIAIAKSFGVKVIPSAPGRAIQMNQGATIATGEILLFLHGDTLLPSGYDQMIQEGLGKPGVIAGAFELEIATQGWGIRWVERLVRARSRFFSFPYGDQAIFLKTSVFQTLGGFPELPIMEDFEFIQTLRKQGNIIILPAAVITSGRRWQKLGIVKTTLINQMLILGYYAGVSPSQLARWYRGK
jgi:rSAM/selenodomain-associated transferase 2